MIFSAELISGFLGAIIGGAATIVAAFFSFRNAQNLLRRQLEHEKSLRVLELRQARGEELFGMLEAWGKTVFSVHLPLYMVMKGEISYNDYLDFQRDFRTTRITMLIASICFALCIFLR